MNFCPLKIENRDRMNETFFKFLNTVVSSDICFLLSESGEGLEQPFWIVPNQEDDDDRGPFPRQRPAASNLDNKLGSSRYSYEATALSFELDTMEAAAIIIGSTFKVPGEWDPQMMSYPFFTVTARSSVLKTIN